jgi:hypothetical protein
MDGAVEGGRFVYNLFLKLRQFTAVYNRMFISWDGSPGEGWGNDLLLSLNNLQMYVKQ